MTRVGAPAPSPDGKWVVFSVTEPAYDEKDQVVRPLDRAGRRQRRAAAMTSTKAGESGVAWSAGRPPHRVRRPSARATRQNQIYVTRHRGGGEAARVTHVSTGARPRSGAPTASAILFTSRVYPERDGRRGQSADRRRAQEDSKLQGARLRLVPHPPLGPVARRYGRRTSSCSRSSRAPKAVDLLAGHAARRGAGLSAGAIWTRARSSTPPGRPTVSRSSSPPPPTATPAPMRQPTLHLFQVAVDRRRAAAADHRDASATSSPRFSPDGRTLYFSVDGRSTIKIYAPRAPRRRAPWPWSGEPKMLTTGLRSLGRRLRASLPTADRSTSRPRTPASKSSSPCPRPAATSRWRSTRRAASTRTCAIAASRRRPCWSRTGAAPSSPAEVVRIDPAGKTPRNPDRRSPSPQARDARLAAAPALLVHQHARPPDPQHDRTAAATSTRRKKYPLLVADPRRRGQHVARPDHAALELPPARAARATSCC